MKVIAEKTYRKGKYIADNALELGYVVLSLCVYKSGTSAKSFHQAYFKEVKGSLAKRMCAGRRTLFPG